jgi:rRNA maturation endonuclease Nob1
MMEVSTCIKVTITSDGKEYDPIKYGDEHMGWGEGRCHDCNVEKGGYHHPGCDAEECPVCGGQLISCDCMDEEEDSDGDK